MKAILVVDEMPKKCNRCRLQAHDNDGDMICAGERLTAFEFKNTSIHAHYWNDTKPKWCPLKPLPSRNPQRDIDTAFKLGNNWLAHAMEGFNGCLDRILEGFDSGENISETDKQLEGSKNA